MRDKLSKQLTRFKTESHQKTLFDFCVQNLEEVLDRGGKICSIFMDFILFCLKPSKKLAL